MKTLLKTLSTSALILATGLTVAAPQEVGNPQVNGLEDPCLSYYRDFYGPDAVGEPFVKTDQTSDQTAEVDLSSMEDPTNYYNW
ncbi:MAG: hypothetical protein NV67_15810 [Gammaproteobacteria bacterium (ex Lamellibrachia satsuma)]|nr:MAG: hypothetical protein HPY30_15690 [Gammaproteobacteria bacterium (ex Lamellibrachia satsuma)]RRS33540.1 MAG: hypothetical protein NV67_15810 [Gammaproteobacteria bacterium (ex Lamellibrachia satsuma)]